MSAIVADTGGLLRALARGDNGRPTWPEFEALLVRASAVIVPALVLAEVDYFLRDERDAMKALVRDILDPESTYELEPVSAQDLSRAMMIDVKFSQLALGLVDGMVAAVAERRRIYRVLTIDRRDFSALRVGTRFDKRLEIVP